jgi:hypothetical protein
MLNPFLPAGRIIENLANEKGTPIISECLVKLGVSAAGYSRALP